MTRTSERPSAKPPLVIINPRAGSGAGHDRFRHVEHELLDHFGDLAVLFTDARGDAEDATRDALEQGTKDIIVVGGDGTINEVVNGWFQGEGEPLSEDARLILLGGGTGSDFVRSLGLGGEHGTLDALRAGRTRRVDVGSVRCQELEGRGVVTRRFVNIASFGLSSLANTEVEKFSAMGGTIAYAAATALSLLGWSNPLVRVTYSGPSEAPRAYEGPVVVGAFANGRYFGSGMMMAPDAQLDDGLMDLVLVGDLRRRDVVRFARHLYDGTHVEHPAVTVAQSPMVDVEGPYSVMIEADGDVCGRLPAQFTIQPKALQVVA